MKLSYSNAQTFKTCKRKYRYSQVDVYEPSSVKPGLTPKEKAHALALGSHGHAVVEHFLKAMKPMAYPYTMADINVAQNNAIAFGMKLDMVLQLEINAQLIHFFFNVFPHKGWRIVEVEKTFLLPLGKDSTGEDRVFPFTIDLMVEVGGKLVIVDHKFAADAYKEDRIAIEPQLPLYIGALRALGYKVSHGTYNFLRTRKMKNVEEQVVQADCKPNLIRIKQAFQEHLETYDDVLAYINRDNPQWPRNTNNNCSYCDFRTLCGIEMRGDDTELYVKSNFTTNDYGYSERDL